ncbi:hypothetical protein PUN28_020944 [Cardiocondyla obscurior]|uniref:Uncharacterized protein n=1 Tax=Cardiocondyla obscurior TaxID=286306 RepID=A0AAW2E539_9HYME
MSFRGLFQTLIMDDITLANVTRLHYLKVDVKGETVSLMKRILHNRRELCQSVEHFVRLNCNFRVDPTTTVVVDYLCGQPGVRDSTHSARSTLASCGWHRESRRECFQGRVSVRTGGLVIVVTRPCLVIWLH